MYGRINGLIFMKKIIPFKKRLSFFLEKTFNILSLVNPGIRARLVLAGLIAFIFTAGVLQWSMNYGRLAYDMTYDDVGYFLDAYSRIQVLYQQGIGTMLSGVLTNPPHSPWSSLLAFIGFAVFGPFDWAPYLMNGISIFLFLTFLVYILRRTHFVVSALLTVLFLFIPFSFFAVHEFRPDFIVGLSTCVFSFLAIESFSIAQDHDKLKLRCAGIIFGIALLSKPSFFAHTLALAIFVSVFIILFPMLTDYRKWQLEKSKNLSFILRDFYLPGIILVVPYYAFAWRPIWDYFWTNTRGGTGSTIWNLQGSYWEIFKSFTIDGAVALMISGYLYFFVGIVILSIALLIKKRKWQELYVLSGLLVVALVSLVIIIYGQINNMFFGLTYQIMLSLAVCYCLSAFYGNRTTFRLLIAAFILFSGLHVIVNKSILHMVSANKSPLVRKETSVNLKIIRAMDYYLKKNNLPVTSEKVFVSFAGDINASSMKWLAYQNSLPLEFSDLHMQDDLVAFKEVVAKSNFIIVADEDADGIYKWLPSYSIQKPALNFLRSQPDTKEILIVETKRNLKNSCIRIFTKTRLESVDEI